MSAMLTWIQANLSSIIAVAVLLGIVSAIVIRLIKNKKAGKSICGCGCENCAAGCRSDKGK